MKNIYHRKILRLTTWVALTVGLSLSTSAIASSPPKTGPLAQDSTTESEGLQQQDQQQQDQQQDQQQIDSQDQQARADDKESDLPGDIKDFAELVNKHEEEGIDDIYDYVDDGTNSMADAIGELIPDDDNASSLQDDLDGWKSRLHILGQGERPDFASLTSVLFGEGADLLDRVQKQYYPNQDNQVQEVRSAADSLDGETNIQDQKEAVQSYFSSAATAIQQMYTTRGDQVTSSLTLELVPASAPGTLAQTGEPQQQQQPDQAQQEEDDEGFFEELFSGDGIPRQVNNFEEFVQQHRERGIDHVADYTRQGTQHYHDAMKSLVDKQDQDMELVKEQLDDFQDSVDALDDTHREEYPTTLVNTLNEGTQILTSIQQASYPQYENQVREIENSIAQIDTGQAIEDQVNAIENVYIQASASLRSMAEADEQQQEEPVSLALDGGADYDDDQPMEQDQPMDRQQEPGLDQDQDQDQIGSGPEISPGVQDYVQYVDNLRQRGLEEQGEDSVIQGLELLSDAIAGVVENTSTPGPQEQPGLPETDQEPGQQQDDMDSLEQIQYGPDDQQDRPRHQRRRMHEPQDDQDRPEAGQRRGDSTQDWQEDMPRQAGRQDLDGQFQAFNDSIQELKDAQGKDEFSSKLKDSTDAAVQLLTAVQEQSFPAFSTQLQQIRSDSEKIDGDTELLEQSDQVLSFFTSSAQFLQEVEAEQSEDLQVSLKGVVLLR